MLNSLNKDEYTASETSPLNEPAALGEMATLIHKKHGFGIEIVSKRQI